MESEGALQKGRGRGETGESECKVNLPCGIDSCKRIGAVLYEDRFQSKAGRHDGKKHEPSYTWERLRSEWLKLKGHGDKGVAKARLPGELES